MNYKQIKLALAGKKRKQIAGIGTIVDMENKSFVVTFWGRIGLIYYSSGTIHIDLGEEVEHRAKRAWRINKVIPGEWEIKTHHESLFSLVRGNNSMQFDRYANIVNP